MRRGEAHVKTDGAAICGERSVPVHTGGVSGGMLLYEVSSYMLPNMFLEIEHVLFQETRCPTWRNKKKFDIHT